MTETTITLTDLKRHLGQMVNRAAYGQERIILLAHGKPHAVLLGMAELERLERLAQGGGVEQTSSEQMDLLAEMEALRAQMSSLTDSVVALQTVREERSDDLIGLP